jgi:serine/threonine protein phosphatase PrpC
MSAPSAHHEVATPVSPLGGGMAGAPRTGGLRQQWALVRRARLQWGWASLCGASHERNQDAVLAAPPLFAVADGVGGGSAGELASSELLALCRQAPPAARRDAQALSSWLREADAELARRLQALGSGGRSAATFAGAWLGRSGRGLVAHVGDSRVLLLRPRRGAWAVQRLTTDQTYAQLGEAPPPGGRPDDPARMLGVGAAGTPAAAPLQLRENDWLLLCSDGLHRHLPEPDIADACRRAGTTAPLHALAQQLAHAAQARGSRDDVSVLLVRLNPRAGARRGFWLALLGALALALAATLSM